MNKTLEYIVIPIIFILLVISYAGYTVKTIKEKIDTIEEMQERINNQTDIIRDQQVICNAYDELIVEHEQTIRDMAYIASISPLRNVMSPIEISKLLKEVPHGNIFFTPFHISAEYGISIGYHGEPRTDHRGMDCHPIVPANNLSMDMRVKPIASGYVETIGDNDVYGKFVIVRHSERVRSFSGHLQKIFYTAIPGEQVTADTVIGIMGNTGMVYSDHGGGGKHVHFEVQVWDGDTWVSIDPEMFMINGEGTNG